MSINGIYGYNYAPVRVFGIPIPEYLIKQLIELGIDPKTVQSPAEAMNLIEQAKDPSNGQVGAIRKEEENKEKEIKREDNPLYKKAKALARKLGLSPSEQATLDDILAAIQRQIQDIIDEAEETGDEDLLSFAKECQFELDLLISEKNGADSSKMKLFDYIEMLAEQNKAQIHYTKNNIN